MSSDQQHFALLPKTTLFSKKYNALSVYARVLYPVMVVQQYSVADESFTFSYKEIRAVTGMNYRATSRAIKDLDKAGFLSYNHGGLGRGNSYTLEPSWLKV